MTTRSLVLLQIALCVAAAAIGAAGFEGWLRWKVWRHFTSPATTIQIQNGDLVPGPIDAITGRRREPPLPEGFYFSPNAVVSTVMAAGGKVLTAFSVRTNALGYLSDSEYQIARDPTRPEYRIVVLGDSMTGVTTGTRQWVDALEDVLNASTELRAALGGATFRTYNLGWPGAGFPHFAKALREKGMAFAPDLVLVNFIENDFGRTLASQHLTSDEAKLEAALTAARDIQAQYGKAIFAAVPLFNEMSPARAPKPLTDRLARQIGSAVVDLRDYVPQRAAEPELRSWYNLPHDHHFSDRGGEIYARALAAVVAQTIAGKKSDFAAVASRHFIPAKGETPTGKSVLRIAANPIALASIQAQVGDAYARTRAFDFSMSFAWMTLTGRQSYLYQRPLDKALQAGYLELAYGPGADDRTWLLLTCTAGPFTLQNSGCWQWFIFYVRD